MKVVISIPQGDRLAEILLDLPPEATVRLSKRGEHGEIKSHDQPDGSVVYRERAGDPTFGGSGTLIEEMARVDWAVSLPRGVRRPCPPKSSVMRAKVVLLAAQGLDNKFIGSKLSVPRQIVSKWRKRFFELRLDGLQDRARPGRPSVFPP